MAYLPTDWSCVSKYLGVGMTDEMTVLMEWEIAMTAVRTID